MSSAIKFKYIWIIFHLLFQFFNQFLHYYFVVCSCLTLKCITLLQFISFKSNIYLCFQYILYAYDTNFDGDNITPIWISISDRFHKIIFKLLLFYIPFLKTKGSDSGSHAWDCPSDSWSSNIYRSFCGTSQKSPLHRWNQYCYWFGES